ncbi:VWA domain-containing protein [Tessaracoccus defluvii]|uniref:VWA domain-containing protein n=1 Tax=Tessaracoccus defluvii TaxID=1285901 RepID=UPI0031D5B099
MFTPVVVVMDTSDSMNEGVGGLISERYSRIQAARSAVLDLVGSLGADQPFGLLAYPGRGALVVDGCKTGRVEVAPGPLDPAAAAAAVRRLTPDGNTPTGPALRHAASLIRDSYGKEARGVIVLVSDGESNCGEPPVCEVADEIRDSGLDVQINTVGLNLAGAAEAEMRCVADATGGRYVDAGDGSGDELSAAIASSAQATLSLTVDAPDSVRVVNGTTGSSGGDVVVTVRAGGRVAAADVRVSLTVRSTDDTGTSTVLVPRPVRFLGNLDVGVSRSLVFAVRPDDLEWSRDASWTVTATATNAAPAIVDGTFHIDSAVSRTELGGVLAEVDSVVVLGDSYSSGEGASFYSGDTDGGEGDSLCHRSQSTYAHAIWADNTTVIACSGAVTSDFFAPQNSGDQAVRPQLLALRDLMLGDDPPEAVVMSIGGNDAGFGLIGRRCIYGNVLAELRVFSWPAGWRCDQGIEVDWSGARTSTTDALERAMAVQGDIVDVLRSVDAVVNDDEAARNRSRRTVPIVVVPYPRIVPETLPGNASPSGCVLGVGGSELAYLNQFLDALNTSVSLAAYTLRSEGRPVFVVTTVEGAFQPDHTICEGGELSYGVTVSTTSLSRTPVDAGIQLLNTQELLHPTPEGHTAMARAIVAWSQTPAAEEFDLVGTPIWDPEITRTPPNPLEGFSLRLLGYDMPRTQAGGPLNVDADGFLPATEVVILIESDPRVLGSALADDEGRVSALVRLPSDLPAGEHHAVVLGQGADGTVRAVAVEVQVLPRGGPWLYAILGLGVVMVLTGVALRPWRRRDAG